MRQWNTLDKNESQSAKMADEQEDDSEKQLIRQLINKKCIVMLEKLSIDLDYIVLDNTSMPPFHTNVIFYPKNLNNNLIKEISERIKEKVNVATKNINKKEIFLVPLVPTPGDIRSYFLHNDDKIRKVIENTGLNFVEDINGLERGQNVVAVSFNFIGEARNLPQWIEDRKAKLVKVIFILGVPLFIRQPVGIEYDEIIPINKVIDSINLLLKPEEGGG